MGSRIPIRVSLKIRRISDLQKIVGMRQHWDSNSHHIPNWDAVLACGLGWSQVTKCWIGVQIPHAKGQFLRGGRPLYSIGIPCWELCKNGWTNRDVVWDVDSGGRQEACIRWAPDSHMWTARLRAKRGQLKTCLAVTIFKVTHQGAELVQMLIRGALDGVHTDATWQMIKPSVCSSDAALCQII